jgi:hypothetical protein
MNSRSSALRLAATGVLISRQCTSSAPCSSIPVGSVPGIRLERAQNALRWPPGGNLNGQATNPGRRFNLGLSARHATSAPETIDWRRKFATSAPSETILVRDRPGGRRRRLVHVAPATAARPTGRSLRAHPEIISQKARKSAPRAAAARFKPSGALPVEALNSQFQGASARGCAIALAAWRRSAGGSQKDRRTGLASREQSACCDAATQGYHVPRNRGSIGRSERQPGAPAFAGSVPTRLGMGFGKPRLRMGPAVGAANGRKLEL